METLKSCLYFLKRNLLPYFLKRKLFLFSRKWKLSQKFILFQEPYISEKRNFLYFRKGIFGALAQLQIEAYPEPWQIQNPDIFRTRNMFRTLVYLEPETYSEHCQISTLFYVPRNKAFWPNISIIFQEATLRAGKVKRTRS